MTTSGVYYGPDGGDAVTTGEWEMWVGDRLVRSQCCGAPIERHRIISSPVPKRWRCTKCLEQDTWIRGMDDGKPDEYSEVLEIMWT